jgi:hypothetical protein
MAFEAWDFILAEQALWAGDVAFAEELLKRGESFREYRAQPSSIDGPLDLMSHISALRRHQIAQRRGERTRFRNSNGVSSDERDRPPTVLTEFQHIRGVLCSLSNREFILRAFVSSQHGQLVIPRNARSLAEKSMNVQQDDRTNRKLGNGVTWVSPADLFSLSLSTHSGR